MQCLKTIKTVFKQMSGKYEQQGDYLIPCLTLPAEEEQPIGIWTQRRRRGTEKMIATARG